MTTGGDAPDAKEKTPNATDFSLGPMGRLRRRAQLRKLFPSQFLRPPDIEPTLSWDHWAIACVMAGSFIVAAAVLIFG